MSERAHSVYCKLCGDLLPAPRPPGKPLNFCRYSEQRDYYVVEARLKREQKAGHAALVKAS